MTLKELITDDQRAWYAEDDVVAYLRAVAEAAECE